MIVVAFDPGETTGYAIVNASGLLQECGQFPYESRFDEMLNWFERDSTVFIYESFRLRQQAAVVGSEIRTIQVVGVLKYLAAQRGHELIPQQPSQKIFFGNDRLKRLGLYKKGIPHAMDAVRHAFYYITFTAKTFLPPS